MKKPFSFPVIIILITIFLLSVLVRLPNINRPLSKHHEFVTAISLRVIDIWQMDGAAKYHFNPVMNYPGVANKYINKYASTTGKMVDSNGNYYYVSHPQFAYILPYLVFQLLHVKATVLAIELFNLVINFISALFIYLIIGTLRSRKSFERIDWVDLCGFMVYLFSAGVLWFQCNTYMSDMLVHLFFVAGVYYVLQLFIKDGASRKYFILYAATLFLMIYTSWLGIFFAFSVFLYSASRLKKKKIFKQVILITILISIAAIGLFVYQYSLINGLDDYLGQMLNRLQLRSGWQDSASFFMTVKKLLYFSGLILTNYITSYLPFILLLGFFIYKTRVNRLHLKFNHQNFLFIWISVLPIILLHAFLSEYSGHDFVSLYGSLFLSVAIALFFDKLNRNKSIPVDKLKLLVLLSVIISVISYYYINRPGRISLRGDEYSLSKQLGLEIKNTSTNDAVIFTLGNAEIDPQLIFYAQRNIKEITTKEEAFDFLKTRKIKRGFIYYSSNAKSPKFDKIEEIGLENEPDRNN
ncbi:MAG TPA: hypothetical protein VFI29_23350 [Hanamia sp.]|nr:hypothetical protein [Hanamia sp.]